MSAGAAYRTLRPQVVFGLWCLATCVGWILLSQVRVVPIGGKDTFIGLDGALSLLEEKTIDARLDFRGDLPSPIPLFYLKVDSKSLAEIGNFPWSRAVFARALNALFERGNIRAAGVDFVFGNTGLPALGRAEAEAGSIELGRTIQRHPTIVLAASYGTQTGVLGKEHNKFPFLFDRRTSPKSTDFPELPDYPVVGPTWGHVGLINTALPDLRVVPAFARTEFQTYYTMALELALLWNGLDASDVEIQADQILIRDKSSAVLHKIPLLLHQLVEPNWFAPWSRDETPNLNVAWVLEFDRLAREGTEEEKQAAATFFGHLRGSVVLIGPTDPMLGDNSVAPRSGTQPVPRVSIHGNLLKTILAGQYITRLPVWANSLLICLAGLGTARLSVLRNRFSGPGKVLAVVFVAGYVALAFVLFARAGVLLPVVAPLGAALSCTFLSVIRQLGVEEKQRQRIKDLFGTYVSTAVVNEMVENNTPPRTGGDEVVITAFFSDVVSFSPLAESLSPTDLVELMCQYFGECTAALTGETGTLDKYVGDAIIAMFGAPLACADHAAAACRASLALQAAQARLRERWSNDPHWPASAGRMCTRVGLHTGPAIVGNIGSELRFNYTMMGDTVNLAQRVEASASHYKAAILVSGETHSAALAAQPDLVFLPIDRVLVPGRKSPVDLFELLGRGEEDRRAHEEKILRYVAALHLYREGRWAAAATAFNTAAALFQRQTSPATTMRDRCLAMRDSPQIENFIFTLSKGSV